MFEKPLSVFLKAPLFSPLSVPHMRILLITHYYEPEVGAPQRRWSALVKRLIQQGNSVTVLCPSPHYPDSASSAELRQEHNRPGRTETGRYGETIHRLPYLLHGYSGKVRALDQMITAGAAVAFSLVRGLRARRCRNLPFDVVVSTVPGVPALFAGDLISKILRIPHVAEMRDSWPDVVTGDLDHQIQRIPLAKKLVKQTIYHLVTAGQRSADTLVVTTEDFAQVLRQRGMRRVHVVSNGAGEKDFSSIEPLTPAELRRGELRVQYLGTVGRSQGLETFISALSYLKKTRPDLNISARIMGEGADVPALKTQADDAGVVVEFHGTIVREQLVEAYRWADVELVSLRKTKPFAWTVPSKIFELMTTQRRILAAVEGSAAEIIQRSGAGTVVEPENVEALAAELDFLAEHPELLVMDGSGVEFVGKYYSYDRMAELYESLLQDTVQRFSQGKRAVKLMPRRGF